MKDEAPELKPCPFCGSREINLVVHANSGRGMDHRGDDVWTIGCHRCGGSVPARYNDHGKGLLIAAWNRRADLPPTLAEIMADERVRELVAAADMAATAIDMAYGDPHEDDEPQRYSKRLRAALARIKGETA